MEKQMKVEEEWDLIIKPTSSSKTVPWRELSRVEDLMFLFVKRDFISLYKQTVLGPLWVVIQPILTTITFFIVFSKIANIGTGGIHPILFYMLGVTIWTYFSDCVVKTSDTFIVNQSIFGKVYFPRMIVPLSLIITNLIKLGIQTGLFLGVYFFYMFIIGFSPDPDTGIIASPSWYLVLIPVLIFLLAGIGLGFGLIISGLTTKYRDLRFLIQFGIQLMMYATPVVWPLKNIDEKYHALVALNPITGILETFKVAFFGLDNGVFNWWFLGYSALFTFIVLFIGTRLFGRVEKSFIDTI